MNRCQLQIKEIWVFILQFTIYTQSLDVGKCQRSIVEVQKNFV